MNKNDLYLAFNDVDDDILLRSEAPVHRRKSAIRMKWIALAACLVLIISMVGVACAAEVKEYSAAVDFFEQNGLSTDGLSRSDVKAVYRDITARNFTYDKTAEVLSQTVQGLQIIQDELTPEELKAVWDENWMSHISESEDGKTYIASAETKAVLNGDSGFMGFDRCRFRCYQNNSMLWLATIKNFYVNDHATVSDGLAIWGCSLDKGFDSRSPWLGRMDNDGNVLWERKLDHGFEDEDIEAVVDNGDGTWSVFSRADENKYLCLSKYNSEGNELSFKKNEVNGLGVLNAIRLGDGYLVQMSHNLNDERGSLVKMDNEGNLLEYFSYEEEDCVYFLEDMVEFGGKAYLSAYVIPKEPNNGGKEELADLIGYKGTEHGGSLSDEEIARMVQENYTAVLLVCDPAGGTPKNFYSVEGSLGGELRVDGDKLHWGVQSITHAHYDEMNSNYNIKGLCKIYRYTFDANCVLVEQEDTGRTANFGR